MKNYAPSTIRSCNDIRLRDTGHGLRDRHCPEALPLPSDVARVEAGRIDHRVHQRRPEGANDDRRPGDLAGGGVIRDFQRGAGDLLDVGHEVLDSSKDAARVGGVGPYLGRGALAGEEEATAGAVERDAWICADGGKHRREQR